MCFKFSSGSSDAPHFLLWQVFGNIAGFSSVLVYTGLLRYVPLHVAFPLTQGLAVVSVQLIAARWVFHENIAPAQWAGSALIVAGIVLVSFNALP